MIRKERMGYDPSITSRKWETVIHKDSRNLYGGCGVTWRTLQLRSNHYQLSLIWLVLRDDGYGMNLYPKVIYFKGKVKKVKHMLNMKVKLKKDSGLV